jgi:MFS family permease
MAERSSEMAGLVGGNNAPQPSALRNFLLMSFCFGSAHGGMVVAIAYASSVLGSSLGSASTGTVYSVYGLTALLGAAPAVERFGPAKAISAALLFWLLYLAMFVIAMFVTEDGGSAGGRWAVVLIGAVLGGFGSGIGLTAQGVYFARAAATYRKEEGLTAAAANDLFAGYFATIFMGSQCVQYLLAAVLLEFTSFDGDDLFGVFAANGLAMLALVLVFLEEMPDPDRKDHPSTGPSTVDLASIAPHAAKVIRFTFGDRRAVALMPLSVAFGFATLFVASFVNENTVSDRISSYAVGYCGVIQTGTVALVSVPFSRLSTSVGKWAVVGLGAMGYCGVSVPYLAVDSQALGHWRYMAPLFVAYGLARVSWENTTRALYADYFPSDRTTAFASLNFVVGMAASAYAYVLAAGVDSRLALASALLVPSLLLVPGYLHARNVPSEI